MKYYDEDDCANDFEAIFHGQDEYEPEFEEMEVLSSEDEDEEWDEEMEEVWSDEDAFSYAGESYVSYGGDEW